MATFYHLVSYNEMRLFSPDFGEQKASNSLSHPLKSLIVKVVRNYVPVPSTPVPSKPYTPYSRSQVPVPTKP